MNFCEKCNMLAGGDYCPACGSEKLREVTDEDFCYFKSLSVFESGMLEFTFEENNIERVCAPFYSGGVTRARAGRADGRRVYVHYKDFEKADEIYKTLFSPSDEN